MLKKRKMLTNIRLYIYTHVKRQLDGTWFTFGNHKFKEQNPKQFFQKEIITEVYSTATPCILNLKKTFNL